ncbi:MAG: NAD(P)-binding domain-containing protein, partial [Bacteroidota bacterium]
MIQKFGIIGSGSWATALVKILTDNKTPVNWWMRSQDAINHIRQKRNNQHYLSSVYFDTELLTLTDNISEVVAKSEVLVIAVPSAYIENVLSSLKAEDIAGKKIVSAIKGILPGQDILLNEYLDKKFGISLQDYFAVLGPCHAEEVAAKKLSYLTFSGLDETIASEIATNFKTDYINTIINHDIIGVQYAAVLKNIYALGAGIAHGLDYG